MHKKLEHDPSWAFLFLLALVLTLVASVVNFLAAQQLFARWLKGYIAKNGHSGVTDMDLGLFVGNLIFYPGLLGFYLILVLPLTFSAKPQWLSNTKALIICMVLPVAAIGFIWFSSGDLFWIITLPAVVMCAAAVGLWLFLARKEVRG